MLTKNILQKNYTTCQRSYQLKLPFNIDCIIPVNDSVRLISQFIEEMDLTNLYSTYSRVRENNATPEQMLKIILYAYMNKIYSSRDIEIACRRDINFMYLLEGAPAPDHSTIARFRSIHFEPWFQEILSQTSNFLILLGEADTDSLFIDGTKIESNANKYTFVWKKSITKNLENLLIKIATLVAQCEEHYGFKIIHNNQVKMKHLKLLRKKLYTIKKDENLEFVYGCGKRKSPLQKSIELMENYLNKLKEYTMKLHVCGKRNSYSKTDKDATFMRMKEDHMKNGQLKPAYNLQHGVNSGYIMWLSISDQPTDTTTLIPFLKEMEEILGLKYKKIVADAGYESEENYVYIQNNGQLSYIKPSNYEISKSRKYNNDISRIDNMEYNELEDIYVCKNNKKLRLSKVVTRKSKTGYKSQKSIYTCNDCKGCEHKEKCIKGNNHKLPLDDRFKSIETSRKFNMLRKQSLERILTPEGCELRTNRSIQAEGSFGVIKQDMEFRRFLCKGKGNVLAESILLAIAHNVNKLHNKIQCNKTGTHLFKQSKIA